MTNNYGSIKKMFIKNKFKKRGEGGGTFKNFMVGIGLQNPGQKVFGGEEVFLVENRNFIL